MKSSSRIWTFQLIAILLAGCVERGEATAEYTGSGSCRECHERFYQLWEPSRHSKAMQPYSIKFAEKNLSPQGEEIVVEGMRYRADIKKGYVLESGPNGERKYPIEQVLGGKNVYFFLTSLERGRLQVLPVSYHVEGKKWFDTTGSMVRHFGSEGGEAVAWIDPLLAFNTSCSDCHVSQLQKNYDLATDTYRTEWGEPGINCEVCHGPGSNHIQVCREAGERVPEDLKVISWKSLSAERRSDACSVCHARLTAITTTFDPGDRFFDHHDIVCLEDRDFYPDGRDLGENYTYTSWLMSPCVSSGELDCLHCHSSNGRYLFKDENHNDACLPCHEERVKEVTMHTRHLQDDEANRCVSCHMPMTEFGYMKRTDHSMRPPSPLASREFESPNACNLCHKEKKPEWATEKIERWYPAGEWNRRIERAGRLVQWAREEKWEHLSEILRYIGDKTSDDIVVTSLVRMLHSSRDERKLPSLKNLLEHRSPLVRAAAVMALKGNAIEYAEDIRPLLNDEYRLVRIRAAEVLLSHPREGLPLEDRRRFEDAERELVTSMSGRPDDWASHYNMGNYRTLLNQPQKAIESFEYAIRLRPDVIMPYVNAAMTASRLGDAEKARMYLRKAREIDPADGVVNFNLGLLLAEQNDMMGAEEHLRKALEVSNTTARAAYNLAIIVGNRDPAEAVSLCWKALEIEPNNARYRQALDYYSKIVSE